jgi:uncharacterized membrane protein YkvA (DUF1232 family)
MRLAGADRWKNARPGRGLWGLPHGLWVLLCLLYLLSPIDAIPDFIPVFGQMDDAGILLFLAYNAVQWVVGVFRRLGRRRAAARA